MSIFRLPQGSGFIWNIGLALPIGYLATAVIYFEALGRSGRLGIEDAIMIPIMGSTVFCLMAVPVVAVVNSVSLRSYTGSSTLFAWNKSRPVLAGAITLLFFVPITLLVWLIFVDICHASDWFDFAFVPSNLMAIAWLALLRAAAMPTTDNA